MSFVNTPLVRTLLLSTIVIMALFLGGNSVTKSNTMDTAAPIILPSTTHPLPSPPIAPLEAVPVTSFTPPPKNTKPEGELKGELETPEGSKPNENTEPTEPTEPATPITTPKPTPAATPLPPPATSAPPATPTTPTQPQKSCLSCCQIPTAPRFPLPTTCVITTTPASVTWTLPQPVSGPSPSESDAACVITVTYLPSTSSTLQYNPDAPNEYSSGILVDLQFELTGPSSRCGGSYALIKLTQTGGTDFQHVANFLTSDDLTTTSLVDARAGRFGEDERRTWGRTVAIPKPGRYDVTIDYQHRQHFGALARFEGDKLNVVSDLGQTPPITEFLDFIDVPTSCFPATPPDVTAKQCCDCGSQMAHYQSPGYWKDKRTTFVPFFRPPISLDIKPVLDEYSPGGIMIVGSSRMRTIYYDLYHLASGQEPKAVKAHKDLSQKVGEMMFYYNWQQLDDDYDPSTKRLKNEGKDCTKTCGLLANALSKSGFCTPGSNAPGSTIVLGSAPAANTGIVPNDLVWTANLQEAHIEFLVSRCKNTNTRVIIVDEMGINDAGRRPSTDPGTGGVNMQMGNALWDNRNVLLNEARLALALKHNVPMIDAYSISKSAGLREGVTDIAHYYAPGAKFAPDSFLGDIVSRSEAGIFVEAIALLATET